MAETLVLAVPISLIYLWFKSEEGRKDSVFTFVATVSGIAFTYFMGLFYFHNQPFASYETIVAGGDLDNAFPSQHTATVFSCFWSFLYLKRNKLASLLGIAGVLTGLGRVFVGHHYPVDIAGGIFSGILGLSIGILCFRLLRDEIDLVVSLTYRLEKKLTDIN